MNSAIMAKILVTGGMGYIGSHACLALIDAGYEVCILDNLCNSHIEVLQRLEQISSMKIQFIKGDIRDANLLRQVFSENKFVAVMHFAGLKAVGESVSEPLKYYDTNVRGSIELLKVMAEANVKTIIFSSSATVYGNPKVIPIKEDSSCHPVSPYGQTKFMVENILMSTYEADAHWKIACLRYFNPVGAHTSGLIGEDPQHVPDNLMPFVAQVAVGRREMLAIFGNNYSTKDGTGIRDYIHVLDLVEGHIAALKYLEQTSDFLTLNLGTGQGYSVLDIVATFEAVSSVKIPVKIVERRAGDIAQYWADPTRAKQLIGWEAKRNLHQMCFDTWHWQQHNPNGYRFNVSVK